jgi:predicted GNAT family acetyltransferase
MIKQISINDIEQYKKEAEKSGLLFCKSASLYGLFIDGEMVAFTGIIIQGKKAIFKNHFVPEKNRGNGYFKTLLNFSIELCKQIGVKTVEATCTPMSEKEYLKRRFEVVRQYKSLKKVRHENIR